VVSVSESNPEKIEGRKTRINTGFSTFVRIGSRPKDSEKERPEGRCWAVTLSDEHVDHLWCDPDTARDLLTFDTSRDALARVIEHLRTDRAD
jgi:hypothetical protein